MDSERLHAVKRDVSAADQSASDRHFLNRGSKITLLGMVAGNLAPVLVILLARAFKPEVFGLYVSVQLLVLTVSKLAVLGLDRGLTWYVAQHSQSEPERAHEAVRSATWLVVAASFSLVALSGAAAFLNLTRFAPGLEGVDSWFVFGCFCGLPGWSLLHIHAGALEGLRKPEYRIFLNQALVFALAPAIALLLSLTDLGRWSLPIGLAAANSFGATYIIAAMRRVSPNLKYWVWPKALDRSLLSYSIPIGLNELLAGLLLRADLWMLLLLLGPKQAAVYAVMSTLSGGVRAVRQSYDQVIIPVVTSIGSSAGRRLSEVFSYAVHVVSSIQLAVAVIVLLLPAELLLLAGKEYVLQPQALSILLAGHLVQGFIGITGTVVLALGHSRPLLYSSVIALVVNVVGNALLIPSLGIVGAAVGTLIAVSSASLLVMQIQLKLTRTWPYLPHLTANAIMVAVFIGVALLFQPALLSLGLGARLGIAACLLSLVGGNYWLRRRLV